MPQELVFAELSTLERKLSLLIKEHQSLKDKLKILQDENTDLKSVVAEKLTQIDSFNNKFKISKLVDTIGADKSDTAELKKKLDEYIKEIDKCIAHLQPNGKVRDDKIRYLDLTNPLGFLLQKIELAPRNFHNKINSDGCQNLIIHAGPSEK